MAPPITVDIMVVLLGRCRTRAHVRAAGLLAGKISRKARPNKATLHSRNGSKYVVPARSAFLRQWSDSEVRQHSQHV
jgi:hypothetical protein